MVRYLSPRNRVARRFGVNIFGRIRNPLLHKANPRGSMVRVEGRSLTTVCSWKKSKS